MMPLGPSTKTFLVSAAVGATSATRFAAPVLTFSRTNSTSDRVFPKPRPASSNQINQSLLDGGSWFGRAKHDQLSNPARMAAKSTRLSDTDSHNAAFVRLVTPSAAGIDRHDNPQRCGSLTAAQLIEAVSYPQGAGNIEQ